MKVLGIESSCDDTGVAVYDDERGLLVHKVYSQMAIHGAHGGVVPELASRDHLTKLLPLLKNTLQAGDLTLQDLDGIAYTAGPGLNGALLVGAAFARSLGWTLAIPTVAVHHMEGHLMAPMLEEAHKPEFPFLALLVSGGHTLLVAVRKFGDYEVLGQSIDDAVGEAFDKTARMMGLPYPGGPKLAAYAEKGKANVYNFPRTMTRQPGLDFSFSGLKTFALNVWQHSSQDEQSKADIARAFEEAVAETMVIKCRRALQASKLSRLVVSGGVSANKRLRLALNTFAKKNKIALYFPSYEFCTDNGAMIAYVGCCRLLAGQQDDLKIQVDPRWRVEEIKK